MGIQANGTEKLIYLALLKYEMGVIFDLDGTLINSINVHAKAMKKAMDTVLGKDTVPIGFVRANIRYPSSILFKRLKSVLGSKLNKHKIKRIMLIRDAHLTEHNIKKIKFFNGVSDLLEILSRNGITHCIATSMNTRELKKFIPALNLYSIAKTIVNSPHLRYEKPNPYILDRAVKICRMKRAHTYYIGDSPYDYLAAKRAGIHFIGVFNKKELGKHSSFCKDLVFLRQELERNLDKFRD